jgi:hypothetical protein
MCVTVKADWEIPNILAQHFPSEQKLASIITIAGSAFDAQAATCAEL